MKRWRASGACHILAIGVRARYTHSKPGFATSLSKDTTGWGSPAPVGAWGPATAASGVSERAWTYRPGQTELDAPQPEGAACAPAAVRPWCQHCGYCGCTCTPECRAAFLAKQARTQQARAQPCGGADSAATARDQDASADQDQDAPGSPTSRQHIVLALNQWSSHLFTRDHHCVDMLPQ